MKVISRQQATDLIKQHMSMDAAQAEAEMLYSFDIARQRRDNIAFPIRAGGILHFSPRGVISHEP